MLFLTPYLNMFLTFVVIGIVFLFRLKRRRYFIYVVIPIIAVCSVGLWLIDTYVTGTHLWLNVIPFLCMFALLLSCFKISVFEAFFFAVICYAVQNSQINLSAILNYFLNLGETATYIINQVILLALIVVIFFMYIRKLEPNKKIVNNAESAYTCVLILAIAIFLNYFVRDTETTIDLIARVLLVLCVFSGLNIAFGASSRINILQEKEAIEAVLQQEKELHALSKDNNELLNMKYHDLKHFILACYDSENLSEKFKAELQNMEEMIKTYECFVKTGNEDLDTVLAEKGLKCNKYDVAFNVVADGEILSFISPSDIYSLFGNAIDNAINSVLGNEDKKQRFINLNVRSVEQFVSIRIENYCSNDVVFENGFPVSSDTKRSHYGVKSIRYIVEKYNGNICMEKVNDIFVLSIMIPQT